jgi:putative redox protein
MATTASVHTTGAGLRQEVRIDDRHSVLIDEPECLGGSGSAPSPFDLLAAALAGCVSITVRMYADRKGVELAEVGVDVELDREHKPLRGTITLLLPAGLDEALAARLEHVAKACPVSRLLEHGMAIEHRVILQDDLQSPVRAMPGGQRSG